MSVWVNGFTEAKIDGKWQCIDFFQYDSEGKLCLRPCIEGQSRVSGALQWSCEMLRVQGYPEDMSDEVRKKNTVEDGEILGSEKHPYTSWYIIEGSWFKRVNLDLPLWCGFFTRQALVDYLVDPDDRVLDTDEMLSVEEYQELDSEAKKAYQYYEYKGDYDDDRFILRGLKNEVLSRIYHRNEILLWRKNEKEITLDDVRVLITID